MQHNKLSRRALGLLGLTLGLALPGQAASSQDIVFTGPKPQRHWAVPSAPGAFSGVHVTDFNVHVTIEGQTATTTLSMRVDTWLAGEIEAELLVPVPQGISLRSFEFVGSHLTGSARLVPAAEATALYLMSMREQAGSSRLIEFATDGQGAVLSSPFPLSAGAGLTLKLTYAQQLGGDGSRLDYELPRSSSLQGVPPFKFQLEVLGTPAPLALYSPTHGLLETQRASDRVSAELEPGQGAQPGSLRLSILRGGNDFAGSLMACPDVDGKGGTFLLFAGMDLPRTGQSTIHREVTIVLDRSGSMAGPKFEQARAAALQVIEGLHEGELFRIVDYSSEAHALSSTALVKDASTVAAARAYLAGLTTGGNTHIQSALESALAPPAGAGCLPVLLFLTDGVPTAGEQSEAGLRSIAKRANVHGRRIFTFGVGNDVNAPLLDSLADATRAVSTYVRPQESVEVAVTKVFAKLQGPLLADLKVRALNADGSENLTLLGSLMPRQLPDIYAREQLVLLGRYEDQAPVSFEITGRGPEGRRTFLVQGDLRLASVSNDFVPRLWASRRIAELTDQIRNIAGDGAKASELLASARNKQLTDEILSLALDYGVLSEFTAFLAQESTDLTSWKSLSAQTSDGVIRQNVAHRSGAAAVNMARNQVSLKGMKQQALFNSYWTADDQRVSTLGVRPVRQGVMIRRGTTWVQGCLLRGFEGDELPVASRNVDMGSPDYRKLLKELVSDSRADVASIGGQVLIRHRGEILMLISPADPECSEASAPATPPQTMDPQTSNSIQQSVQQMSRQNLNQIRRW